MTCSNPEQRVAISRSTRLGYRLRSWPCLPEGLGQTIRGIRTACTSSVRLQTALEIVFVIREQSGAARRGVDRATTLPSKADLIRIFEI